MSDIFAIRSDDQNVVVHRSLASDASLLKSRVTALKVKADALTANYALMATQLSALPSLQAKVAGFNRDLSVLQLSLARDLAAINARLSTDAKAATAANLLISNYSASMSQLTSSMATATKTIAAREINYNSYNSKLSSYTSQRTTVNATLGGNVTALSSQTLLSGPEAVAAAKVVADAATAVSNANRAVSSLNSSVTTNVATNNAALSAASLQISGASASTSALTSLLSQAVSSRHTQQTALFQPLGSSIATVLNADVSEISSVLSGPLQASLPLASASLSVLESSVAASLPSRLALISGQSTRLSDNSTNQVDVSVFEGLLDVDRSAAFASMSSLSSDVAANLSSGSASISQLSSSMIASTSSVNSTLGGLVSRTSDAYIANAASIASLHTSLASVITPLGPSLIAAQGQLADASGASTTYLAVTSGLIASIEGYAAASVAALSSSLQGSISSLDSSILNTSRDGLATARLSLKSLTDETSSTFASITSGLDAVSAKNTVLSGSMSALESTLSGFDMDVANARRLQEVDDSNLSLSGVHTSVDAHTSGVGLTLGSLASTMSAQVTLSSGSLASLQTDVARVSLASSSSISALSSSLVASNSSVVSESGRVTSLIAARSASTSALVSSLSQSLAESTSQSNSASYSSAIGSLQSDISSFVPLVPLYVASLSSMSSSVSAPLAVIENRLSGVISAQVTSAAAVASSRGIVALEAASQSATHAASIGSLSTNVLTAKATTGAFMSAASTSDAAQSALWSASASSLSAGVSAAKTAEFASISALRTSVSSSLATNQTSLNAATSAFVTSLSGANTLVTNLAGVAATKKDAVTANLAGVSTEYGTQATKISTSLGALSSLALGTNNVKSPFVVLHPLSQTVALPGTTTATFVSAAGNGYPVATIVKWQVSADQGATWTYVNSATNASALTLSLTVSSITSSMNAWQYRAAFSNISMLPAVYTNAAVLTVSAPATITAQPVAQTVKSPIAAVFSVVVEGAPKPSLQWQTLSKANAELAWANVNASLNWQNYVGQTQATLSVPTDAPASVDGCWYRCIASNSSGPAVTSLGAKLTVYYAPTIDHQPYDMSVPIDIISGVWASAVVGSGNPAYIATGSSVKWYVLTTTPGAVWTVLPDARVTLSTVAGSVQALYQRDTPTALSMQGWRYRCTFTNSQGMVAMTNESSLYISTRPTIILHPTSTICIAQGSNTATFVADVSAGIPGPELTSARWQTLVDGTWTNIAGATSDGLHASYTTPVVMRAMDQSMYRAIFNNFTGLDFVITDPAVLTVWYAPLVQTSPTSQTIGLNASATFKVVAANGNPPFTTVRWEVSTTRAGALWESLTGAAQQWQPIVGAAGFSYTSPQASAAINKNEYRAILSNESGVETTTSAAVLTVLYPPQVSASNAPTDQIAVPGNRATFTVVPTAGNPSATTIQWQVWDGVTLTSGAANWLNVADLEQAGIGGITGTYQTPITTLAMNGRRYRAKVTNSVASIFTPGAGLVVNYGPPQITQQPQSTLSTSIGSIGVSITARASSGDPLVTAVQWQVSTVASGSVWTNFTGAPSGTSMVNGVATLSLGAITVGMNQSKYRAVFSNSSNSSTSSECMLVLQSAPTITQQPTDQTGNAGESLAFSVTYTSAGGPATVQWQWSEDNEWTTLYNVGAGGSSYTIDSLDLGMQDRWYRALIDNLQGITATTAVKLTVNAAPTLSLQPLALSVDILSSATVARFEAAATDGYPTPTTAKWQYWTGVAWSDVQTTSAGVATSVTTVTAGVATSVLTMSSMTTLLDGRQYKAVFANATGLLTASSNAVTLTAAGLPEIISQPVAATAVSDGAASQNASFSLTSTTNPPVTSIAWFWTKAKDGMNGFYAPANTPSAGATSFTVTGATSSSDGRLYKASVTNAKGTTFTIPAVLTVQYAPTIVLSPPSVAITAGASGTFTASASGQPVPTVKWQVCIDGSGSNFIDATAAHGASISSYATAQAPPTAPVFTSAYTSVADTTHISAFTTVPGTVGMDGYVYKAVFSSVVGGLPKTASTNTTNMGTLRVNFAPIFTTQPVDAVTVKNSSPATFTCVASGYPSALTYQWQWSADGLSGWTSVTDGTGGTTSSYTTVVPATAMNLRRYRVIVSNTTGSSTSAAALLTVQHTTFGLITGPSSTTVVGNVSSTATFTSSASGEPRPTGQWMVWKGTSWSNVTVGDGSVVEAAVVPATPTLTSMTFTVANVTSAMNQYKYKVNWRNFIIGQFWPYDSSEATLTVNYAPVITATEPAIHAPVTVITPLTLTNTATPGYPSNNATWQVLSPDAGTGAYTSNWTDLALGNGVAYPGINITSSISGAGVATLTFDPAIAYLNQQSYRTVFSNGTGLTATTPACWIQYMRTGVRVRMPDVVVEENRPLFVDAIAVGTQYDGAILAAPTWKRTLYQGAPTTLSTGISTVRSGPLAAATGSTTTSRYTGSVAVPRAANRATYETSGWYNGYGVAATATCTLTVLYPPEITTQATSRTVAPGTATSFSVVVSNFPVPPVRWKVSTDAGTSWSDVDLVAYPTANTTTLAIPTATSAMNLWKYKPVFTGDVQGPKVDGTVVTLNVGTVPVISVSPVDQIATSTAGVTFTSNGSADPAPTFQWQVATDSPNYTNWVNLTDGTYTSINYTTAVSALSMNGYKYRVAYTNNIGTTYSSGATFYWAQSPVITIPSRMDVPFSTVYTISSTLQSRPVPTTYKWFQQLNGGSWIEPSNNSSQFYTVTSAANNNFTFSYRLEATNSYGTTTSNACRIYTPGQV